MGGNFKFKAQDSFFNYFFEIGRFEKRISLSEKRHLYDHTAKFMISNVAYRTTV